MKQPSDFTTKPWSSVFRKCEAETIAANIMVILKRTGNQWRELPYAEYEFERRKDGGFTDSEMAYFDQVRPYTVSAEKAAMFSPTWKNIFELETI
jgi:hypothetical protein